MPVGNTAPSEEKSQQWRAVGNIVSDLTAARDLNLRPPAPETNALMLDQIIKAQQYLKNVDNYTMVYIRCLGYQGTGTAQSHTTASVFCST